VTLRRPPDFKKTYGRLRIIEELPDRLQASGRARRRMRCLCACGASTDGLPYRKCRLCKNESTRRAALARKKKAEEEA
jgi:hypothetical protein